MTVSLFLAAAATIGAVSTVSVFFVLEPLGLSVRFYCSLFLVTAALCAVCMHHKNSNA